MDGGEQPKKIKKRIQKKKNNVLDRNEKTRPKRNFRSATNLGRCYQLV